MATPRVATMTATMTAVALLIARTRASRPSSVPMACVRTVAPGRLLRPAQVALIAQTAGGATTASGRGATRSVVSRATGRETVSATMGGRAQHMGRATTAATAKTVAHAVATRTAQVACARSTVPGAAMASATMAAQVPLMLHAILAPTAPTAAPGVAAVVGQVGQVGQVGTAAREASARRPAPGPETRNATTAAQVPHTPLVSSERTAPTVAPAVAVAGQVGAAAPAAAPSARRPASGPEILNVTTAGPVLHTPRATSGQIAPTAARAKACVGGALNRPRRRPVFAAPLASERQ